VKITMYYGDHGVPHFHVIAPDFNVSVAIASLEVLAGAAQPCRTRECDRLGTAEPRASVCQMGGPATMRQPRIEKAEAEDGGRLRILWIDGSTSLIDLSELGGRLEGLGPLRDPLVFAKARVGDSQDEVESSPEFDRSLIAAR
jgi:hypothetical protein